MGDHRASIKIEFSMYGEEEKWSTSINYDADGSECHGIDQRVIDFFRESYNEMHSKYTEKSLKWQKEAEKQRQEAWELQEYERLKHKFEPQTKQKE